MRWLVLDADSIGDLDITGAEALENVLTYLDERDVTFAICRTTGKLRTALAAYGLLEQIGEDRVYATNREAAAAFRQERG